MIESALIRNFRSFNEVKVENFSRINIIVGENGSGKTALLEALFLAAGVSPEIALRTRSWRGFELGKMSGSDEDLHRALWADLFHKFQTKKPALVSLKGTKERARSVTVKLKPRGHVRIIPPSRKKPGAPVKVVPDLSPIEFKWSIPGSHDVAVSPTFEGGKLIFPPVPDSHVRAAFYAANQTPSGLEVANHFSKLSRTFHADDFIEKFNVLYPSIKNLSVEVSAGVPMLFADVDGLPEKIPLSLASGGMSKLAAILLGISNQAEGIILVDEIENGFYYKRLPMVWNSLLEFARGYDCQLFVSTHSAECLEAAAELAKKNPDEFSVMRTVSDLDGAKIRNFGGGKFVDAFNENIEIR